MFKSSGWYMKLLLTNLNDDSFQVIFITGISFFEDEDI